ncbi:hypothetical protein TNCV_3081891 [Trichonephila clavipes]|nr:hypothetical protein TNCV_3081891 [Trichonephila clavipes]
MVSDAEYYTGEGMDVCKCLVPVLHGGVQNIHRAASPLKRYDEEFVKDVLSVIVEERTATEKQKAAELEEKQKAVVVAQ